MDTPPNAVKERQKKNQPLESTYFMQNISCKIDGQFACPESQNCLSIIISFRQKKCSCESCVGPAK